MIVRALLSACHRGFHEVNNVAHLSHDFVNRHVASSAFINGCQFPELCLLVLPCIISHLCGGEEGDLAFRIKPCGKDRFGHAENGVWK